MLSDERSTGLRFRDERLAVLHSASLSGALSELERELLVEVERLRAQAQDQEARACAAEFDLTIMRDEAARLLAQVADAYAQGEAAVRNRYRLKWERKPNPYRNEAKS